MFRMWFKYMGLVGETLESSPSGDQHGVLGAEI